MKRRFISIMVIAMAMPVDSAQIRGSIHCETELSTMSPEEDEYKRLEHVSLIALIANPKDYHDRRISVAGFFELYFDRIALFATKEHLEADEFSSMIYADFPKCATAKFLDEASEWRGNLVRIEGVFNAELGQFNAGTMQHVECVQLWYAEP